MRKTLGVMLVVIVLFGGYSTAEAQLTAAQLTVQIEALTQQILLLQQQIKEAQAAGSISGTAAPTISGATCPTLSRSLYKGISGDDVTSLQKFLAADSSIYPEGLVTGYFGTLTEAAVKRWQAANGVVSSGTPDTTGYGVVGPLTRTAIQKACGSALPITTSSQSCSVGNTTLLNGETRVFYSTSAVAYDAACPGITRTCTNGVVGGDAAYSLPTCVPLPAPNTCTLGGVTTVEGASSIFYNRESVLFGQQCEPFGQFRTCNSNGTFTGDSNYQYSTCTVTKASSCDVVVSSATTTTVAHGTEFNFYSSEKLPFNESCMDVRQLRLCTDGHISGNDIYKYPTCTAEAALSCTQDFAVVPHGGAAIFYSSRTVTNSNQEDEFCGVFRGLCDINSSCSALSKSRTCTNGTLSESNTFQYSVCALNTQEWCLLDGKYTAHGNTSTYYSMKTVPFGNACAQFSEQRTCDDKILSGSSTFQYSSCTALKAASCTLDGKTVAHGGFALFYSVISAPTGQTCTAYVQARFCNDGFLSGSSSFANQSCS